LREASRGIFSILRGIFFSAGCYIVVGIVIAFRQSRADFSFRKALTFCFPRRNFASASATLDYKFVFFSSYLIFYPVGLVAAVSSEKLEAVIAPKIATGLSFFGTFRIPLTNGFWLDVIYTLVALMIVDLGMTLTHILFHRVPWLWEFHKVHHSATELNIFTVSRLHPVDSLGQIWSAGIFLGLFAGLVQFSLGFTPSIVVVMNANWAWALFRVLGIFRHSHVGISYGRITSHIVGSPAMHQIHHSAEGPSTSTVPII
jgi:sterol desaturase/sphingolipid hydroxylase (fatty acid hydroxylase superfamily)